MFCKSSPFPMKRPVGIAIVVVLVLAAAWYGSTYMTNTQGSILTATPGQLAGGTATTMSASASATMTCPQTVKKTETVKHGTLAIGASFTSEADALKDLQARLKDPKKYASCPITLKSCEGTSCTARGEYTASYTIDKSTISDPPECVVLTLPKDPTTKFYQCRVYADFTIEATQVCTKPSSLPMPTASHTSFSDYYIYDEYKCYEGK